MKCKIGCQTVIDADCERCDNLIDPDDYELMVKAYEKVKSKLRNLEKKHFDFVDKMLDIAETQKKAYEIKIEKYQKDFKKLADHAGNCGVATPFSVEYIKEHYPNMEWE